MIEKDALSGVLRPVCQALDISITANKGYCSSSTMYEVGKRLYSKFEERSEIMLIYLGDHDPSGIDMSRDIEDRIAMYSGLGPTDFRVVRIALNFDQVQQWNPPENPAKQTDSRFKAYVDRFGESSWELDAVQPATLAKLVQDIVIQHRDNSLWYDAVRREDQMRAELKQYADNYKGKKK